MTSMQEVIREWHRTDGYLGWWIRMATELVVLEGRRSGKPLTVEEEEWLVQALPVCFALRKKTPTELKPLLLELRDTAPKSAWGRARYPGETLFERLDDSLGDFMAERRKAASAKRKQA